jgi:hypothetical protein
MTAHQSKAPPVLSNCSQKNVKEQALTKTHPEKPKEVGGPKGPEPTRYGDWEKAGRCTDF